MDGVLVDSRLTITFDLGMDGEGKPIYRNKSFNNIKTLATDDQVRNTALALTPLQQHPVGTVDRVNTLSL